MDTQVKAGVGVIVRSGDRVLVGLRSGSHGEGLYAFPGGHIDPTDLSLAECGEREVLEETGIRCRVVSIDDHRDDLFTTFDILSEDGSKRYVTSYLLADYIEGGETLGPEGTPTGFAVKPLEPHKCKIWIWVTLDELEALVNSETQRSWIPIKQVLFYLRSENGPRN